MKVLLISLASVLLLGTFFLLIVNHKVYEQSQVDESVQSQWNLFKIKYSKKYEDFDQESYRIQVFAQNLEVISQDTSGSLGITKFSDLTPEEFKETYLKSRVNILEADEARDKKPIYQVKPNALPINWVTLGKVTSIKNEGTCAASWVFSTTASIESCLIIAGLANQTINLSEQQLIDCDNYNYGCASGNSNNSYRYVKLYSLTSEASYPYRDVKSSCIKAEIQNPLYSINQYQINSSGYLTDLQTLIQQQPITAYFDASTWQNYVGGVLNSPSCQTTTYDNLNHAALVVGYENSQWIVKNSWGTNWGSSGYIYLSDIQNCGIALYLTYPINCYIKP